MIEVEQLIDDLDALALRADRLSICRRDPERFFVERGEIVDDLRRLIARLQRSRAREIRPERRGFQGG